MSVDERTKTVLKYNSIQFLLLFTRLFHFSYLRDNFTKPNKYVDPGFQ